MQPRWSKTEGLGRGGWAGLRHWEGAAGDAGELERGGGGNISPVLKAAERASEWELEEHHH